MSGSTIGGIAGGVIGFVVTGFNPAGAQFGFMVGSMLGAAIDPDKIRAPDGRDAQEQTTTDGIPIPVVYGSPPPFMGTVLDGENKARRIKGEFRSGKGGPQVQEPDKYLWTGAILICEGPIDGLAFIVRNGVIVADWRDNPKIPPAETAKFASKIRIYLGDEAQLPDPALEAIHGVGNTPYYRGRAYMVIVDDDVTDTAGRIAQYAFGVVKSGHTQTVTVSEYASPPLSRFQNADWPLVDPESEYVLTGFMYNHAGFGSDYLESFQGNSIQEIKDHFATHLGGSRTFSVLLGYSASTLGQPGGSLGGPFGSFGYSGLIAQPDIENNSRIWLAFADTEPQVILDTVSCSNAPAMGFDGHFNKIGIEVAVLPVNTPGTLTVMGYCNPPGAPYVVAGKPPLYILVERKRRVPAYPFGDPCDLGTPVKLPDAPEFQIDCDGDIRALPTISSASGTFRHLSVLQTATIDGRTQITAYPLGPVLRNDDPNYNSQAFWESAYAQAVASGDLPAGMTYGVDYPHTASTASHPAYFYNYSTTTIAPDQVFLKEVQEDLAYRCDVPVGRIDATELAGIAIPGYMVAAPTTGANASRTLQPMFFYDMPEVDGKIRCVRRGKASIGTLTDADFIEVENGDEDIRSQQVEFPKAIHLSYPDPDLNYAITKQTFSRDASAVISVDEQIVTTTIPFDGDTAAKVVDIMGKVAWSSAEGRMKCVLPREFTLWTPSDCFDYRGKRWLITKADYETYGRVRVEALYDRASNYDSTATGKNARPPGDQTSGLRGPTRLETINLSPLLDSQDRLGLYFAVCGILEGWAGGTISASIDGGATYTTLGTWRDASVMGHTTTVLGLGSPWVYDPDATVTVKVHGGELESATFLQLLNEANACVIGDEAVQFAAAVEVDDYTYTLTGLTRARHGTTMEAHPIHSRFVLLDDTLNFVELPASWIGRPITLHVQSLGTPPGTGYTETFVWQPANSQTEWPPFHFTATHDGSSTRIGWIGRARLGSTASPFHSDFFDGYRITFTDGATSVSYTTAEQFFDYSDALRIADFGSTDPLDVSIVSMNRITGASQALTGTI